MVLHLQLVCSAYLMNSKVQSRRPRGDHECAASGGNDAPASDLSVMLQAFGPRVTHPKSSVFGVVILHQFVHPARGAVPAQMIGLA